MGKPMAFPAMRRSEKFDEDRGKYVEQYLPEGGMELRDYFAAHASEAVPEWFTVEMPPHPKRPTRPTFEFGQFSYAVNLFDLVKRFGDPDWSDEYATADGCIEQAKAYFAHQKAEFPDDLCRALRAHADAIFAWQETYKPHERAVEEWRDEKYRRLAAQWPYAWADLLLAERSK